MKGIHRRAPKRGPIVARRGIALGLVMTLFMAGIALADTLIVDGGGDLPVVAAPVRFGDVCPGSVTTRTVVMAVNRNGSATPGINVFQNGAAVTVSVQSQPSEVSTIMNDSSIMLPSTWTSPATANGTLSLDTASATLTFTAGAEGGYSKNVVFKASGSNVSSSPISRDGTVLVEANVLAASDCAPADSTPPVIDPTVEGTLGSNGWYVSDVTLSWSTTDAESTISSKSGCDSQTVSADTESAGITYTCSATSDGGNAQKSVTIKRDATKPTIEGEATSVLGANAAGWFRDAVEVDFDCGDAIPGSGVATCEGDVTLSTDGVGQNAVGTATDNAGNTDTATVLGIHIDTTSPVTAVKGVTDGADYIVGSVPAATCETEDETSGVAVEATPLVAPVVIGSVVGRFMVTCSGASDNAGNVAAPAEISYRVVYDFDGFFRPIDMSKPNVIKAGSAVPVKFSLNGDQGLNVFATGYPKATVASCDGSASYTLLLNEETLTAGNSGLSYDLTTDQYTYVWKTVKGTTGCRMLTVMFVDGTTQTALFQFTK